MKLLAEFPNLEFVTDKIDDPKVIEKVQQKLNKMFAENEAFRALLESIKSKYSELFTIHLSTNFTDGTFVSLNQDKTGGMIHASSVNAEGIIRGIVFELCNADNENLCEVNDFRKYNSSHAFAKAVEVAEYDTVRRLNWIFYGLTADGSSQEDLEFMKQQNNDSLRRGGLTHFDGYRMAWLNYHIYQNNPDGLLFRLASLPNKMRMTAEHKKLLDEKRAIEATRKETSTQAIESEVQAERERITAHENVVKTKELCHAYKAQTLDLKNELQVREARGKALAEVEQRAQEEIRQLEAEIAKLQAQQEIGIGKSYEKSSRRSFCNIL
ncbi:cell envelope integrity protein TolA [Candidatus Berkiella aquae]|uniref:Cell envelope integrity protein TolA n=1 Tax=Candidatus Berkiella aquae TaxID=295108 RepID=A0A0Q9Z2G0_9GAMM|nr:cell envelope integrity protein TolA [Candidatus Berkiella aquae]MCS5711894.1 cell envelope integrity protein TolA [Candidatus Berkiella aquae]